MRKLLARFTLVVFGLYLAACLAMFLLQRQILFVPGTRDVALDVALVPNAAVIELVTGDGETIKAWWVPPRDANHAVYLYFHGNAETLASRDGRFGLLVAQGAGLLGVSWRGYGGSTGSPSEVGFRLDALAAYTWLHEQGVAPEHLLVFGESVGTGIAVWLSSQQPTGALILDSPYTALDRLAQQRYPWLPASRLMRDHFDSLQWAAAITVPVIVFHCTGDPLVPYAMGQELFAAFGTQDKHFESVERTCHVPSVQPLLPQFRELERKVAANLTPQ